MNGYVRVIVAAALAVTALGGGGAALAAAPPPNGGTIAISSTTAGGAYDPALPSFVGAASEALTNRGFLIFDDATHAAYLAEVTLSRADVGTALGRDPHPDTAGMAGTGVYVPLSTGKSSVVTLRRTTLEIRIRKRTDNSVVWDGTAVTVRGAGTRTGTAQAVARDLSEALLRAYPAQPGDVIGIP